MKKQFKPEDVLLSKTESTGYEQYNAVDNSGKLLGIVTLSRGYFIVKCPNHNGKVVYDGYPDGYDKLTDKEREAFLESARMQIADYWNNQG